MVPLGPVVARARVKAPRVAVWEFLTDATHRANWWSELRLDPVVGGGIAEHRAVDGDEAGRDVTGEVDVLVRGHALGFTWHEVDERETSVLLTLRSYGDETGVIVTETGFDGLQAAAEKAAAALEDWQELLGELAAAVEPAVANGFVVAGAAGSATEAESVAEAVPVTEEEPVAEAVPEGGSASEDDDHSVIDSGQEAETDAAAEPVIELVEVVEVSVDVADAADVADDVPADESEAGLQAEVEVDALAQAQAQDQAQAELEGTEVIEESVEMVVVSDTADVIDAEGEGELLAEAESGTDADADADAAVDAVDADLGAEAEAGADADTEDKAKAEAETDATEATVEAEDTRDPDSVALEQYGEIPLVLPGPPEEGDDSQADAEFSTGDPDFDALLRGPSS